MPASDDRRGMGEAHEPVLVQAFIAKAIVKRFDVSVLIRLTGFDLLELHTIVARLVQHRLANEFWTVVGSNDFRQATGERRLIDRPRTSATHLCVASSTMPRR